MELTREELHQELGKFSENINQKFDNIDRKFDSIDQKFEQLEAKVDSVKTWFITLALSTILVVTSLMTTFTNLN